MNEERSNTRLYILLIVLIVVAIMGGIYAFKDSGSKNNSAPLKKTSTQSDNSKQILTNGKIDNTKPDFVPTDQNETPDAPLAPGDKESQL